jgi:hypothetical protein
MICTSILHISPGMWEISRICFITEFKEINIENKKFDLFL